MSGGRLVIHTELKGVYQYFWYHGILKNSYRYSELTPEIPEQTDAYRFGIFKKYILNT
jgi:hypothetical protein